MSNEEPLTEDFSLKKLRLGDKAEFARLVDRYSGLIYRLASKMVQNPQDAEDVLQETFIKAMRGLPNFDGRSSLSTWLYRIATNESLMLMRRNKHVTFSLEEPFESEETEQEPMQIVDFCCMPEEELMSTEARTIMDKMVETLPLSLKSVFLLRDIEGLSTRETSEVLNLSEVAVKTRLSRARLRLRERLSEYYGERMQWKGSAGERLTTEGEIT